MATASFVNSFPAAVAVTISEPMNSMFVVNARSTYTTTIIPGSYTVTFSKLGENVTVNDLKLVNGTVIQIRDFFPSATAANGTDDFVQFRTKCKVVNDTLRAATIGLEIARPDAIPALGIPVGQVIDMFFNGESRRSFNVTVDGKVARVTIKGREELVTLYLTSIFPDPLHSAIQYFVEGSENKNVYERELAQAFEAGVSLESYV